MRSPLVRKELRSLLPFLLLLVFLAALDWVYLLTTEFPDQYPLANLFNEAEENETLILLFVMGFAIGMGLLTRERDDQTLDFLDALPVTRTRVFLTKFLLALGALWVLPVSDLLRALFFQGFSRNSLDEGFHLGLLLSFAAVEMSMAVVFLSVGLAFGLLRRFAFLLLGVLFWLYILLREWNVPWVTLANPFTVTDTVFAGQTWLFPWSHLLTQLVIGAACFLVALIGFLAAGDRTARLLARWGRMPGGALLAGGATAAIAIVWIGFAIHFAVRHSDPVDELTVVYPSWGTVRASTRHYEFVLPANLSGTADPLIARADAVEEKVRAFLGAAPAGPIAVDMTGALSRHAGQAYWKKIRMPLVPGQDEAEVDSILGHETTHVYIDALSDSRFFQKFNSTRFFHEGLASYLEYHLFLPPESVDRSRRVAAVMWSRRQVDLEELADNERLGAKYDTDLVYPLGELFVAALIQRHGDHAPGQIVRAMGRPDAPKNLEGLELWQDTFQACGFNFTSVTATFYALLDEIAKKEEPYIQAIPRLRGAVSYSTDFIQIRPSPDTGENVVCRFRARADTPDKFYRHGFLDEGAFHVPVNEFQERSFWYQLGWVSPQAAQVIYEPWVEVRRGG